MSYKHSIENLAKSIKEGKCIAFIGAGASAEYIPEKGPKINGLPLSKELLRLLKNDHRYLEDCTNLGEASFLMKNSGERVTLEKFLVDELTSVSTPLPCHEILAQLNFSAYVSMNFDELLEYELKRLGKNFCPIIHDSDITKIAPTSIPLIKPHGTISIPKTIKIATDETLQFSTIFNLFLNYTLSNKSVLFIGFSHGDHDFNNLIIKLKRELKDYFPKSYSIVLDATKFQVDYWKKFNIEVIEEDATLFLRKLQKEVANTINTIDRSKEPYIKNPMLRGLLNANYVPTETQIIDELIKNISYQIKNKYGINIVKKSVRSAIDDVLNSKPNYIALKNLKVDFENIFNKVIKKEITLEEAIAKLELDQENIKKRIQKKQELISGHKNILLYSQSQRVADLLISFPKIEQENTNLYILECREKSTSNYNEGQAILNLLSNTQFNLIICSDLTGLKLVKNNTIDLMIFGAHSVHIDEKDKRYLGFTNTCGTDIFVELSKIFDVDVALIFELDKEEIDKDFESIHTTSEIDLGYLLYDELNEALKENEKLSFESSKYDYISWDDKFITITDK